MENSMQLMRYTCSAGETFDGVSLVLYGDEKHTCDLLCANPAHCHLMRFRGGEVLEVPVVVVPEAYSGTGVNAVVAPWKG